MVIEFVAEQAEGAGNWRAGHIDERAVALAAIEVDDLLELIVKRGAGFSSINPLEHGGQHRCLHAARRTLATGLASEELRDANGFPDHAGIFGIITHHPAAQ